MGDTGKILYEIHCINVLKAEPSNSLYVIPWDALSEEAKQAWRQSAQEFLRWSVGE